MIYASFGHGSKAGGFVETNTIAVPPPVLVDGKVPAALVAAGSAIRDEFATNYEIGIKSTVLDGRLRLNLAGFWTDVKDFQDTVFTGGTLGFITFNGPARTRGVEFESAFQITPAWRFDGSFTYADATAVIQPIDPATNAPQVDADGNPVIGRFRRSQAPKFIFNAGSNYTFGLSEGIDLNLGAAVRHRSSMFNQRQEQFRSKALTTIDLTLGLESTDERWGIDLVAKNIGNEIAEDFASPSVDPRFGAFYGAYLAGPSPSRTIMLSARFKY
jgi:iron complex outermembrane receptor protein